MPIALRDPARQQADAEAQRKVPEVGVFDKPLETAFGVFDLVKRLPPDGPPVYLLRGLNSAAYFLLYGDRDVMLPDNAIVAVDDLDAARQAVSLIWERADAGHRELSAVRDELLGTPADTTAVAREG